MITEATDAILARLREIPGLKKVEDWHGEIDALLAQAINLPALWLVYTGAQFQPKTLLGSNTAQHSMEWTVVVVDKSLRGPDAAAPGCYAIIEQVREKLIGYNVGDSWLWPLGEQLILSDKGKLAYALGYATETETED